MSSPFLAQSAAPQPSHRAQAFQNPIPAKHGPPGTFLPNTKVQCGSHRVIIEKFLSEGGFAHVYVVRVPRQGSDKTDQAVLKRVAVPDKDALANMRTEVETMKKLKGHKKIVTYIDSHASQLKGGGYEVFLLMEFCSGGGLIDFMNTRLQHRLTEPEILKIFVDVAEGVACMHYLKPPLLHRDLKVENVLISASGSSRVYKLCDFGSTAPPRPAAKTAAEGRLIEDDVQRHTTMQYRSPEMIDVYRRQPIDEKSDIWALGVLLYKLCYYTTPFEEQGQMAILNATFKFPAYPAFSDRTKRLISSMLRENPQKRPNIYQVVKEVCDMRNSSCPIKDIYANRTHSESRRNEQLPSPEPDVASPPPVAQILKSPPIQQQQAIPDITPMRRGRPTAPSQQPVAAKPSPSPGRPTVSDPFAALDSNDVKVRSAAADELASRFPSIDEFSLLNDKGGKFQFGSTTAAQPSTDALKKRVTEALADDAFAPRTTPTGDSASGVKPSSTVSRTASVRKPTAPKPDLPRISQPVVSQPAPQRPAAVNMVSTGVGSSPPPSPPLPKYPDVNKRPIWRLPRRGSDKERASSQPRPSVDAQRDAELLKPESTKLQKPSFVDLGRSKSNVNTLAPLQSPASSRPSLEGSRPSALDIGGESIHRSRSANARPRPSSVHVESNLDYLRDREASKPPLTGGMQPDKKSRRSVEMRRSVDVAAESDSGSEDDPEQLKNISSDMDYLKSLEGDESKKSRRISGGSKHGHRKRTSLPSVSMSHTKNIISGRFGDAFRRFESNKSQGRPRTPEQPDRPNRPGALTPIAGSERTESVAGDNESALDESTELPPEVRRELERRRLSQEEKRVADAAAEYRQRLANPGANTSGSGGVTRASTIQNRVKNLLDSETRAAPAQRTAEGYGKYTGQPQPQEPQQRPLSTDPRGAPPPIARKPVGTSAVAQRQPYRGTINDLQYPRTRPAQAPQAAPQAQDLPLLHPSASAPPTAPAIQAQQTIPSQRTASRPSAPPKPKNLMTGGQAQPNMSGRSQPMSPAKPASLASRGLTSVSKPADFSVPDMGAENVSAASNGAGPGMVMNDDGDWEEDFSKRFPSLRGLEMVEADIPAAVTGGDRGVRDV